MTDAAQFQDIADPVTLETLRQLTELPTPVVSLYVPTARSRPESERAPLELRALLDPAREQLAERGLTDDETDALLAPVRALQEDPVVWSEQAEGLAIFASPGGMRSYRIARDVPASVTVGQVPHLLPLVPVAAGDDRYVVLTLSQKQVRLFEATPHSITQIDLGDTPADIDDMERRNVRQTQLQHQHQPRGGGGGQTASHHGHGGAADIADIQVDKFVREVADGVRNRVGRTASAPPIVLAAVAEYLPKLKETGQLPTLQEEIVAGNHEATSPAELLERSRSIAAARLADDRQERRDRAAELLGTGRATLDPRSALAAAREGRAGELLIDPQAVGSADDEATALDEAVAAALLTGAELHDVPDLPQGAQLAALLRY
ncbi:hypothetical protein BJY21_002117 [Kineosphaera limosa]|uniref:Uncharacterized protein n=1 Tax=Kineosphaera limosa NBRC 100340 TaxID=1184609 RepID=K6WS18_9MICO|nr:hypothetical protein [Kineosphaera limosa]NYE00933.1 hypothetical protein [Kineosphaera limosa]GAB94872.1 hypothetical protein KILIM_014_00070 [Kineosphaera limosa NBRC 100340]